MAVLADKRVIAVGTIDELKALDHPWIHEYFEGPRGRAASTTKEFGTSDAQADAHPTEVVANETGQRSQGAAADNAARAS